jgi:hypothetical protein
VNIRFISTLTPADEELVAAALLKAASALLDQLPIAYALRIETTGAQLHEHTRSQIPSARGKHGQRSD